MEVSLTIKDGVLTSMHLQAEWSVNENVAPPAKSRIIYDERDVFLLGKIEELIKTSQELKKNE